MNIDIKKIVTMKDFSDDVDSVFATAAIEKKLFVFDENKPKYVLLDFDQYEKLISKANNVVEKTFDETDVNKLQNNEIKVGKLARTVITSFIEEKVIDVNEIIKLQSADYSKRVFNMNYQVLKEVNPSLNILDQHCDERGYSRYYSGTVSYCGKTYLLCSQWVEDLHRDSLERWIKAKSKKKYD